MEIGDKILEIVKSALAPSKKVKIIAIAILSACGFLLVIFSMIIGQAQEVQDPNQMNPATGDSLEQFVRYLHTLEGNEGEKGDDYKIGLVYSKSLGKYTRTVGYGVDIDANPGNYEKLKKAGNYTDEQLQDGCYVKKEYVDAIEEEERQEGINAVKAKFTSTGANATEYQIFAFTSFYYNNGPSSISRFHNGDGIGKAYNDYYNLDNSKYLYHKEKVEFSSELAKTYLEWNNEGQLTERRESEWCLFETGWYGWSIDKPGGNGNGLSEYWCGGTANGGPVQEYLKKVQDEGITCETHGKSMAPGVTYNHYGYQCKGYAMCLFYKCFKVTPGITLSNNYELTSTNGMKLVDTVKVDTEEDAKKLFSKARPGDFVQMRRSHGGPHSAIVYSVTSDGTTWMENNTDGNCGTYLNEHSWSNLAEKNQYISVYTATDYSLKQ